MTRTDYKVIFTALSFLAVTLDDVPRDRRALRANALAQLMEAFCATAVPEAFIATPPYDHATADNISGRA